MERHGSTETQLSGTSDFCSEVLKSGISVAVLVAEGGGRARYHFHAVLDGSGVPVGVLTVPNISLAKGFFVFSVSVPMDHFLKTLFSCMKSL